MRRAGLVPGYKQREQELCEDCIRRTIDDTEAIRRFWREKRPEGIARPRGFVAQHHVRFSEPTQTIMQQHGLQPIVLFRNIFDIVPSLIDHFVEHQYLAMAWVPDRFNDLDYDVQCSFVAQMIIPWYINFYVGWTLAQKEIDTPFPTLTYEQIKGDIHGVVGNVCEHYYPGLGIRQIESAVKRAQGASTRKNKAQIGRGEALPDKAKDAIRRYADYYPELDCSIIGL